MNQSRRSPMNQSRRSPDESIEEKSMKQSRRSHSNRRIEAREADKIYTLHLPHYFV